MDEDLVYEVLSVVDEIPEGKVATYGQIAKLINRPRNARLVGKILSRASFYGDYPCHRLEAEGVLMKNDNHVDIKSFQWDIDAE